MLSNHAAVRRDAIWSAARSRLSHIQRDLVVARIYQRCSQWKCRLALDSIAKRYGRLGECPRIIAQRSPATNAEAPRLHGGKAVVDSRQACRSRTFTQHVLGASGLSGLPWWLPAQPNTRPRATTP